LKYLPIMEVPKRAQANMINTMLSLSFSILICICLSAIFLLRKLAQFFIFFVLNWKQIAVR
jgi:hypothetical protein